MSDKGGKAHIEDDEENEINAVQEDKHPKQPPSRVRREQKREASPRVVEQEPQLFPDPTPSGNTLLC